MTAKSDLYRLPDGPFVVILQSDLSDGLTSRVVAPLIAQSSVGTPLRAPNPAPEVGEATYYIMPQLAATLTLGELGTKLGSLASQRDDIVRAVDALLSGI